MSQNWRHKWMPATTPTPTVSHGWSSTRSTRRADSYTNLRAHETDSDLVCRHRLEKKTTTKKNKKKQNVVSVKKKKKTNSYGCPPRLPRRPSRTAGAERDSLAE